MRPLGTTDPHSVASYRLVGVLGGGGMGRVYLGQSPSGRYVAIKVIRPELAADPLFRRRFTREVAAARLVNPLFTAAVVDADTEAESPWLATTYIVGPSLEQRVSSGGPLEVAAVLTLATGLAEALISIHRTGLVHRDLKPANILLDDTGPHIIDFGIALASDAERVTTGVNVGTPSYMAPERIQGEDSGAAGDIFSLGATLYYAATGRTLISGGSMFEQINQVTQGRFDLAALPTAVRPFVVRCISLRPQDRPTAKELSRILIGTGIAAPIPGWFQPVIARPADDPHPPSDTPAPTWGTPRLWQRRPVLAGAVLGLLGLSAGGAWALTRRGSPTPQDGLPPALRSAIEGPGGAASPRGPAKAGDEVWRVSSGARADPHRLVVAEGGRLIGTDGPRVYALDAPSMTQAWSVRTGAEPVDLWDWAPGVLVSAGDKLWRVETSGTEAFDTEVGGPVLAATTTTDRAFVQLGASLHAYDRAGVQKWKEEVAERPLAANGQWLVTHLESNGTATVTLREAATGRTRWQKTYRQAPPGEQQGGPGGPPPPPPGQNGPRGPGGPGGPGGPPDDAWIAVEARLGQEHVVVRDRSEVRVLRLSDKAERWHKKWDKPVVTVALAGDAVVLAADRIVAFRLDTGTALWKDDGVRLRGARLAVAADARTVYAVGEQRIAALNPADGSAFWHAELPEAATEENVTGLVLREPHAYVLLRAPRFQNSDEKDVIAIAIAPR